MGYDGHRRRGDHTMAAIFSPLVQYPIDVSKDLLLIYNSTNISYSSNVCAYYMAHRPMVGNANVLGLSCTTNEGIVMSDYTNSFFRAYRELAFGAIRLNGRNTSFSFRICPHASQTGWKSSVCRSTLTSDTILSFRPPTTFRLGIRLLQAST